MNLSFTFIYFTLQWNLFCPNTEILTPIFQEHGKTAIQKALDALVADGGKVVEKLNGKQKAYVVNQANLPTGMRTKSHQT